MEVVGSPVSSSWFHVDRVPGSYIFPQDKRPGNVRVPICDSIPIIDLKEVNTCAILKAAREFGFFQVINHGIPEKVMVEAMDAVKGFFDMPDKRMAGSSVPTKKGWVYTSSVDYAKDGVHLWRENLKHVCHPLEECIQFWPEKPNGFREVVAAYLVEIRKLSLRILETIGRGLGLEAGYLDELSEVQLLSANNYPPCPDPSLTLGILKHCDPSLITVLNQGDVGGLQVLKDGRWISVGTIRNALIINIGDQLEIISNGKLRSAEHRVVTNTRERRTSIATFINPRFEAVIEPARVLVNQTNPPRFGSYVYRDFVCNSKAFGPDTDQVIQTPNL